MGAACNLGPDKGRLCVKCVRIDLFQHIPAQVVVAVAGGRIKAGLADPILLHSVEDLELVVLSCLVQLAKSLLQPVLDLFSQIIYLWTDAHRLIESSDRLICIHWMIPLSRHRSSIYPNICVSSRSCLSIQITSFSRLNQVSWRLAKCLVSRLISRTASSRG